MIHAVLLQVIYGAGLPFPLNKWLPWRARAAALKHFKSTTAAQVNTGPALSPELHTPISADSSCKDEILESALAPTVDDSWNPYMRGQM